MTRIDFYVLTGSDSAARYDLIAKLSEKAAGRKQKVFVFSEDHEELATLDDTLWNFRPVSFVPHARIDDPVSSLVDADPVQLSSSEPGFDRQVLINLSPTVPPFFSRFERALEIVNDDPSVRDPGRDRYRFYQQRGYPLKHHKM